MIRKELDARLGRRASLVARNGAGGHRYTQSTAPAEPAYNKEALYACMRLPLSAAMHRSRCNLGVAVGRAQVAPTKRTRNAGHQQFKVTKQHVLMPERTAKQLLPDYTAATASIA